MGNNNFPIIFNKNDKIQTNIFIIYLLIIRKYISIPRIIPKIIYILISPLVYFMITNIIIRPETIQNKISCIYVMKSHVLRTLRWILKKSNNNPIHIPVRKNINTVLNWLSNSAFTNLLPFFYLKILLRKLFSFFSKPLSL